MAAGTETVEQRPHDRGWTELVAALLLGLAAVATAWSAHRGSVLDGEALEGYSLANTLQSEAADQLGHGDAQIGYDQQIFLQYLIQLQVDEDLATHIHDTHMREELQAAVAWWAATDDAATPFDDDPDNPYTVDGWEAGAELREESLAAFDAANEANDRGDRYGLATVLLAMTLFFGGVGTLVRRPSVQFTLLGLGGVALLAGLARLATAG